MRIPQLSVSQNFLKEDVVDKVLGKFVKLENHTLPIVDIGAGTGNITSWLSKNSKTTVYAFELDHALIPALQKRLQNAGKVRIIAKDFLHFPSIGEQYCVVANIPFASTTLILEKLTSDSYFKEGYLIVQKEAAERWLGEQVGAKSTVRAALLGSIFEASCLHSFSAADFTPKPNVAIVLISLKRRESPLITGNIRDFENFIAYLFNKSLPEIRRAPILGRFLARRIDLGRISLLRNAPSELSIEDFLYLYSLCDSEILEKISGSHEKMVEQGRGVQKSFRTRRASNWRNMV